MDLDALLPCAGERRLVDDDVISHVDVGALICCWARVDQAGVSVAGAFGFGVVLDQPGDGFKLGRLADQVPEPRRVRIG